MKFFTPFFAALLSLPLTVQTAGAQCLHNFQWPSAAVSLAAGTNVTGAVQPIDGCNLPGDYAVLSGIQAAKAYRLTSSVSTDFITVRTGSPSGPVLGYGLQPLTVNTAGTGNLYVHYSANPACATATAPCRQTAVQCVNCVGGNGNCSNTTLWPAAAVNVAAGTNLTGIPQTIDSCNRAGDYAVVTGLLSGKGYILTSTVLTDYFTVRVGSAGGAILAQGPQPLFFSTTGTANLYVHLNTNTTCGASTACRITAIQCSTCAAGTCTNLPQWPATAVNAATGTNLTGSVQTISTCNHAGEHALITGLEAGQTYKVTSSVATDHVMVRANTFNGPLVAQGVQPLTFTATGAANTFVHFNTNASCGTQPACRQTLLQCTTCAASPCDSVTPLACNAPVTVSLSGGGQWSSGTCGFATPGREKIYSFAATSTGPYFLEITAASGSGAVDYWWKNAANGCDSTGWTCIGDISSPTSLLFGFLNAGTTYYFLLDAETTAPVSQTFRILCPAPALGCLSAPTAPANGAPVCSTVPVTLSWPAAPGATSYDLYFGTASSPPFIQNVVGTSFIASSLAQATYYWKVVPRNSSQVAAGCPTWSFVAGSNPTGNTAANPIVVGGFPFSATGNNLTSNCWTSNYTGANNQPSPDVFYRFTTDACRTRFHISLCSGNFNTYLHLLNASGGLVATNDNGALPCGAFASSIVATVSPGTYFIVVEGNGSATGAYSLTVEASDIVAPVITNCPVAPMLTVDANCLALLPDYRDAIVTTDNCLGPVSLQQIPAPGTLIGGTAAITLTATDASGNSSACSFAVQFADNLPPALAHCPGDQSLPVNANCQGQLPDYRTGVIGADNCAGAVGITQFPPPGSTVSGTSTLTLVASDASGNTAACSFQVAVTDDVPPLLSGCPGPQILTVNAACEAVLPDYRGNVVAADNCPGAITLTQLPNPGVAIGVNTTLTLTATDLAGNTAACTFTVTVVDTLPPTTANCPIDQLLPVNAACQGVLPDYRPGVTATDNCPGNVGLLQLPAPGTAVTGATVVTLRATDAAGNSTLCNFTVQPADDLPPAMACPANQNLGLDSGCEAVLPSYAAMATATDNCPGALSLSQSPDAGTLIGQAAVLTLTATDAAGNSSSCSFLVTVTDDLPPVFTSCPADLTVGTDPGLCAVVVDYPVPTADDNCGLAIVSRIQGYGSGSLFPSGSTVVVHSAEDGAGQVETCSFTVTVSDGEGPVMACPPPLAVDNDPGQCGALLTFDPATAFDNCGVAVVEQTAGPASGDLFPLGASTVVYLATDPAGLTATCSFSVVVSQTEPATLNCPPHAQGAVDPGQCTALLTSIGLPELQGNCSGQVQMTNDAPALFPPGLTVVQWTATDGAGQSATCLQQITITDPEPPSIGCPADTMALNDPGECFATVDFAAAATDNCGLADVVYSAAPGAFPLGQTTVTALATDVYGATATCTFQITVTSRAEICNGLDDNCDGQVDEDAGWTFAAKQFDPAGHGSDNYGFSSAIDGDFAVVGAKLDDTQGQSSGAAYLLYRHQGGADAWGQLAKLLPSDGATGAQFGASVAIQGDYALVGADLDNELAVDAGAVYVFYRHQNGPDQWGQSAKLMASEGAPGDRFGASVAVFGEYAVVGASFDDENGQEAGAAYVFQRYQGQWIEVVKLLAQDGSPGAQFGGSLALDSFQVLVGAHLDPENGANAGAAYLFDRNQDGPDAWGQVIKLLPADGMPTDYFGFSVDLQGGTALVGAFLNDNAGSNAGQVYVFERDFGGGGTWNQAAQLSAPDAVAFDQFGYSVAVDSQTAVVGARLHNAQGARSGAAYVFARQPGGSWVFSQKLTDPSGAVGDQFGQSVDIQGGALIAGAWRDDLGVNLDQGSVSVFQNFCGSSQSREDGESASRVGRPFNLLCYPSPFSDALQVEVQPEEPGEVRITVVNVLGQDVAVLFDGWLEEEGSFRWEAGPAPEGVYWVRVRGGGKMAVRAVVRGGR